jgi:hypothetical protein
MIPRRPLVPVVVLFASLATFFVARPASAGPSFGFDPDLAFPIDSPGSTGGGFVARLGYELHLPLITATPELAFSYAGFGGDFGPNVFRGIAGARVGFGEVIRVGPLAHLGFGHIDVAHGPNYDGFTWDVGGFVDLTLIPLLNIGVHVVYNSVTPNGTSSAYNYLTTGLDLSLVF